MEKGIHSSIDTYTPAIYTSKITGAKVQVMVKPHNAFMYISSNGVVYYNNELTFTK